MPPLAWAAAFSFLAGALSFQFIYWSQRREQETNN